MKYKIEKRVPSSLSYGFDHLTLEGEVTKEDQADYQSAIRVSHAWEEEKKKALENAGMAKCFDPREPDPRHPPRQAGGKPYGAQRPAQTGATGGGGFGAVPSGGAAPAAPQAAPGQGTIFPADQYEALMSKVSAMTGTPRERFEREWLAAATAWKTKDGKVFFGFGPTLHDYSNEQQSKGRPAFTIVNAWKKFEEFAKLLHAEGSLTLRYPTYRNKIQGEDTITLTVKNQNPGGMMPPEAAPAPEGREPGAEEWGEWGGSGEAVPF